MRMVCCCQTGVEGEVEGEDEGGACGRTESARPLLAQHQNKDKGCRQPPEGALTLPEQAAVNSSPRHRATSCTLGSSLPRGRGLPSAPRSWKRSRECQVMRKSRHPAVLFPSTFCSEPRGSPRGETWVLLSGVSRDSRRQLCSGSGGADVPVHAAAAAGTTLGPGLSSPDPAAAPPVPGLIPSFASTVTHARMGSHVHMPTSRPAPCASAQPCVPGAAGAEAETCALANQRTGNCISTRAVCKCTHGKLQLTRGTFELMQWRA